MEEGNENKRAMHDSGCGRQFFPLGKVYLHDSDSVEFEVVNSVEIFNAQRSCPLYERSKQNFSCSKKTSLFLTLIFDKIAGQKILYLSKKVWPNQSLDWDYYMIRLLNLDWNVGIAGYNKLKDKLIHVSLKSWITV